MSIDDERLVEIDLVVDEIFGWIGLFCRLIQKGAVVMFVISRATGTILIKFT